MRKSLIAVLLLVLLSGSSAHAQCAATDKIYIDPRLVPQRQIISKALGLEIPPNVLALADEVIEANEHQ